MDYLLFGWLLFSERSCDVLFVGVLMLIIVCGFMGFWMRFVVGG